MSKSLKGSRPDILMWHQLILVISTKTYIGWQEVACDRKSPGQTWGRQIDVYALAWVR
jgi:hypothetical protein